MERKHPMKFAVGRPFGMNEWSVDSHGTKGSYEVCGGSISVSDSDAYRSSFHLEHKHHTTIAVTRVACMAVLRTFEFVGHDPTNRHRQFGLQAWSVASNVTKRSYEVCGGSIVVSSGTQASYEVCGGSGSVYGSAAYVRI
jgi:hypothetical protein